MSDGVIGSVGVSVVPDAADFWRRFQEQTSGKAGEAGRKAGNDWQRGFEASVHHADVRVNVNTNAARAQVAALNKEIDKTDKQGSGALQHLINTAITLAPAIVPIGGAAAAAGAELATFGAVGVLAFKGIGAEMAAGTPLGAEYSGVIHTLKGDLAQLEQTASGGVLSGFERSVGKLQAELPQLNEVIASQSQVLGDATSHLVGGFVGGFQTFGPLLDQVDSSVERVAAHFELWATGPGGAKFSRVLSEDYAKVAPIVDDIATGVGHLVAASNGVGIGILSELGLLSRVVSAFPTPVLSTIVAGFVAFRTVGAVSGAIGAVSNAFPVLGARSAAAAVQVNAAALQVEAGVAAEAAAVATSQAEVATAFAATQAEIAASLSGTGSVLAASAAESAAFAAEEAAAFQAAAAAAVASSEEIGAAAAAAAAESEAAGAAASLGWSAMLGPIGIVVGAVGLLGVSMLNSSKDTDRAKASVAGYTAALVASKGVIDDTTRSKIATSLADAKLIDAGKKYGLTLSDLIDYSLGNAAAQAKVNLALKTAAPDLKHAGDGHGGLKRSVVETTVANGKFRESLDQQAAAFKESVTEARAQEEALAGVGQSADYAKRQLSDGNTALRGYIEALDTFNKSADTAADRGKLIGEVLRASNNDLINYSNTMVQSATANQQLVSDFKNLKAGVLNLKTGTIDYHNAAAAPLIADLQALQTASMNAAAATYQHELRTRGAKQAADDAYNVYQNNTRGALIDEATHLGLTADQAKRFADKYFQLGDAKDLKKQIELIGEDKVVNALKSILQDLDILAGKTTVLDVQINTHNAANILAGLATPASGKGSKRVATGGYVSGPGSGTSDSIPAMLSNGEYVVNAAQTAKHKELLHAINSGLQGFESGGFVGVDYSGKAGDGTKPIKAAKSGTSKSAAATFDWSQWTQFLSQLGITTNAFTDAKNQLIHALGAVKVSTSQLAVVSREAYKLIADSHAIAAEDARISKARAYLSDLRQQSAQESSTVRSSVLHSFDITSAGQRAQVYRDQPAPGVSIATITQDAKAAADQAAKFRSQLAALRKRGLDKTLIQQLAEAGPEQDQAQLTALSGASKTQIAALNKQYGRLGSLAGGVGGDEASQLFGSRISAASALLNGVDPKHNPALARAVRALSTSLFGAGKETARGLAKGLVSERAALVAAMHTLANTLEAQIRKDLHIQSPSRKMHAIGQNVTQGLVNGIVADLPAVRSAMTRVSGEVGFHAGGSRRAAHTTRSLPDIHIHPSAGMDEVAIGTAAARRVQMLSRV